MRNIGVVFQVGKGGDEFNVVEESEIIRGEKSRTCIRSGRTNKFQF